MKTLILFTLILLLSSGCSSPDMAIKIGFISGLSEGNADIGEAARNGALLAVHEINSRGGIKGRKIELIVRDDRNDIETLRHATLEFFEIKVSAIIGPFTTTLAEEMMKMNNPEDIPVITPTASGFSLSGKDDNLITLNTNSRDNARTYAEHIYNKRKYKKVSVLKDTRNSAFTDSWFNEFEAAYTRKGGLITYTGLYNSPSLKEYNKIVQESLLSYPEALVLISNSIDTARLAQLVRKYNCGIPLIATDWAGTVQLIELGGKAIEGLELIHNFDKDDTGKSYQKFKADYKTMFEKEPDFVSVITYDSATLLCRAMEKKKRNQNLKDAILANSPYKGLQQIIELNEYGDTKRNSFFVTIQNRSFIKSDQ